MKLKELLKRIDSLPEDLEVYVHIVDGENGLVYRPINGIGWQISDGILSFGEADFNLLLYERLKRKGRYK